MAEEALATTEPKAIAGAMAGAGAKVEAMVPKAVAKAGVEAKVAMAVRAQKLWSCLA